MVIKLFILYLFIIFYSLSTISSNKNENKSRDINSSRRSKQETESHENNHINPNPNNSNENVNSCNIDNIKLTELKKDLVEINLLINTTARKSVKSVLEANKNTIINSLENAIRENDKEGVCNSNYIQNEIINKEEPKMYTEIITVDPDIRLIHNFLKEGEADHFIAKFKDRLKESLMTKNYGQVFTDKGRTSSSSFLMKGEDLIVKSVEERIAKYTNTTISKMEPLQLVNYKKGQSFLKHYDWFEDAQVKHYGGQREHTLLLYLNDVPKKYGGGTSFIHLGFTVAPVKNSVLYWNNLKVDSTGKKIGNKKTLHQGNTLLTDEIEKYAINSWISTNEFKH